jgi:hypothetical protein
MEQFAFFHGCRGLRIYSTMLLSPQPGKGANHPLPLTKTLSIYLSIYLSIIAVVRINPGPCARQSPVLSNYTTASRQNILMKKR